VVSMEHFRRKYVLGSYDIFVIKLRERHKTSFYFFIIVYFSSSPSSQLPSLPVFHYPPRVRSVRNSE
jgi:hypothetical protein